MQMCTFIELSHVHTCTVYIQWVHEKDCSTFEWTMITVVAMPSNKQINLKYESTMGISLLKLNTHLDPQYMYAYVY